MKITITNTVLVTSLIIIGFSWVPSSRRYALGMRCPKSSATRTYCLKLSRKISVTHKLNDDLSFFKKCIADKYCFRRSGNRWISVPSFKRYFENWRRSKREDWGFNKLAKRVELFFIRNNDWDRTLAAVRAHPARDKFSQLLYVIAARYFYVVYILRLLSEDFFLDPCERLGVSKHKYKAPKHGACYIPPTQMMCFDDYEIKLLGGRSGTLTGLFNQFFQEPLGRDRIVPGFGKSPQKIFGANIVAFQLEFAMPNFFVAKYNRLQFRGEVIKMQNDKKFQVLEIVVAIYKMRDSNKKYFNDLLSDHVQLRSNPILTKILQGWTVQLNLFDKKINSFVESPHYSRDLSFRRRNNIGYELVMGTIENTEIPWGRMLAEDATALIHGSESYMTRGAARHVVGEMEMKFLTSNFKTREVFTDYWMSMLENWADVNKEYNRECVQNNLRIHVCLLKMSKYLRRMIDAMYKARRCLLNRRMGVSGLLDVNKNKGLLSIVNAWDKELRNKGINEIPSRWTVSIKPKTGDAFGRHIYRRRRRTYSVSRRRRPYSVGRGKAPPMSSSVEFFLSSFKCKQPRYIREMRMTRKCMDAIHEEIRKYNRKLFLMKSRSWRQHTG